MYVFVIGFNLDKFCNEKNLCYTNCSFKITKQICLLIYITLHFMERETLVFNLQSIKYAFVLIFQVCNYYNEINNYLVFSG